MVVKSTNDVKEEYKGKKIGIPRALNYYKFFPFWVELLEKFNCEIFLTPETNKEIFNLGIKSASLESCVPMKVYYGHIQYLIDNYPDLDCIFIPRYVSLDSNHFSCPYFIALPDLIRNHFKKDIEILEWEINAKNLSNIESAIELGKNFGLEINEAGESYIFALNTYRRFNSNLRKKKQLFPHSVYRSYKKLVNKINIAKQKKSTNADEPKINLMVLGHPYNIYDPIINYDIVNWLNKNQINITTIEHLPKDTFKTRITLNLKYKNYYGSEEDLLQAARYFILEARDEIDGILFLTSTGCVCDALINKIIERNFLKIGKPYLKIILDGQINEPSSIGISETPIYKTLENFINKIKRSKF